MRKEYADMIGLERHKSKKHRSMGTNERAAQFAPFSALTGYGDTISERENRGEKMAQMSEDELSELDDMLAALRKCDNPGICVTAFVIDGKSGKGSYISRKGRLKRVDDYERRLIFLDGKSIPLEHILKIQLDEGIY